METQVKSDQNIGVILLAAGASSRLGTSKQLLAYAGQTLLQHSLQVARDSAASPMVVVLGAQADTIKSEVNHSDAHIVVNADWSEGMASSIRYGVKALLESNPVIEGAILMVCDQPFVTASVLNELIMIHQQTGKPIITCSYAHTYGPPTLFHKSMFSELLQLQGDVGARSILGKHTDAVEMISFPEGTVDIDTPADYQKLSEGNHPEGNDKV